MGLRTVSSKFWTWAPACTICQLSHQTRLCYENQSSSNLRETYKWGSRSSFKLDTGSKITFCHESWVTYPWDVPKGVLTTREPYTILTANGTVLNQTHNPILARLTFGHNACLVKIFSFDNPECNLLGMDFVMNNEVSILVSHNAGFNLQFAGDRRTISTSVNTRMPAFPIQEVTIPPGESKIRCKVRDLHCAHVRIASISNLAVQQIKPQLYNVNCSKVEITVNNPLPFANDCKNRRRSWINFDNVNAIFYAQPGMKLTATTLSSGYEEQFHQPLRKQWILHPSR